MLHKAYLEITNVCNLSCVFCPGTKRAPGFLSPEGFRVLAGRLRPHVDFLYLHLMGEPLLHPQLDEILDCARELGFRVRITTNGTLIPQQEALLRASTAVQKVSISLHALEGNQRSQELEQYLDNCFRFARDFAQIGKRCALRLWNLDGAQTRGASDWNQQILARLETFFPKPWKVDWQGTTLIPNVFLEWGEKFDWPEQDAPDRGEQAFCRGLRDQVGVLWDGTVVPCCLDHDGDIPLGNLYEQELDEILNAPRARALYDGFSNRRAIEPLCRRCGYVRRAQH